MSYNTISLKNLKKDQTVYEVVYEELIEMKCLENTKEIHEKYKEGYSCKAKRVKDNIVVELFHFFNHEDCGPQLCLKV